MATTDNPYDAVPYGAGCYRETHPRFLSALAEFHGFPSASPDTAKILEIGCANGGNLIPIAGALPKASCVGVDLSKVQVESGKKQVLELGLKNVRLEAQDIGAITPKFGEFDLIICHGVYSWVTPPLQKKILEI